MMTAAVLLAAGSGVRMGASEPKAFLPIQGRPMFVLSLEAMGASGIIDQVVLVVPEEQIDRTSKLVDGFASSLPPWRVVAGGSTRQESVGRGLAAVPIATEQVLCHDAARPLATPMLFRLVAETLEQGEDGPPDGVVPVVPSPDTVKRVHAGRIVETIPRAEAGLAQTPQAFRAGPLRVAHARAQARREIDATDDAMLLEAAGFRVVTVPGEPENFKITTAQDLPVAEQVLARRSPSTASPPTVLRPKASSAPSPHAQTTPAG